MIFLITYIIQYELDFDVQTCTDLYIFNKTRIAGKLDHKISYKLAVVLH